VVGASEESWIERRNLIFFGLLAPRMLRGHHQGTGVFLAGSAIIAALIAVGVVPLRLP
jgi:hypothetical protein